MRLASKVLPIVCINANIPFVLFVADGTPNSFEVEHVKVCVAFHFFENINREFGLVVSETTHVTIVTTVHPVGVRLAKFALVLLWMVKVFNSVVRPIASVFLGTSFTKIADLTSVCVWWSSAVLLVCFVVEKALLRVVLDLISTGLGFESHQVK